MIAVLLYFEVACSVRHSAFEFEFQAPPAVVLTCCFRFPGRAKFAAQSEQFVHANGYHAGASA